ncbi:SIMPL domain-containing protein [Candidatus Falkowbacteria bacterium]|nr:SIMPL domain-containing protein [Candidatus Falkowbacteria bacterium]
MDNQKQSFGAFVWAGLILGICFIIAAGLGSYAFYTVKSFDNALTVTGSAKKQITSDLVKWRSTFSRNITLDTIKDGYALMKLDNTAVIAFFAKNGIEEGDLTISPVTMNQISWDRNQGPIEYALTQNVEIQSTDVEKITQIAKNTEDLINAGVIFSTQALEYYYTKLPEARIELLSEAVQDAQNRAAKLVEYSGKSVGSLKSASVGVVQLMPVNSTDVSDYGTYDTSTIEKEIMVTVRTQFVLK